MRMCEQYTAVTVTRYSLLCSIMVCDVILGCSPDVSYVVHCSLRQMYLGWSTRNSMLVLLIVCLLVQRKSQHMSCWQHGEYDRLKQTFQGSNRIANPVLVM